MASFYNMIDFSGMTSDIIYRRHNSQMKPKEERRQFLNDLAKYPWISSVEFRSTNKNVDGALVLALGRRILTNAAFQVPRRGCIPVLGKGFICRDEQKQSMIKKSFVVCIQPVCNEHSFSKVSEFPVELLNRIL